MVDIVNNSPKSLSLTKLFIADELRARGGWRAYLYYPESPLIRFVRPDGKILEVYGSSPPTSSFAAGKLSDDKYATYLLLTEHAIPTPKTYLAYNVDDAKKIVNSTDVSFPMVVKPLDSSHGNGVTVGVLNGGGLESAWKEASNYSSFVILQDQLTHSIDLRLTIVGFKLAGAVIRVPARIFGDGVKTVLELIKLENLDPQRGDNYTKPKNKINISRATSYLGEKMQFVPRAGEEIQVVGTANLGTGGELVDVTELIPEWLVELAEEVSRVCELPVSGVDIMVSKVPSRYSTRAELDPQVIEINKSPSLFLNDIVQLNGERTVTKAFIDYLEQL